MHSSMTVDTTAAHARLGMTNVPRVSIVMPSLNQARFIDAAVQSVLSQDYPNIELIVADGGSRDNTIAALTRWQAKDGRLRWFSRPDRGPAHALNDAMDAVRGTIIGWLNSDDLYTAGAISRAAAALAEAPQWLMVYGRGQHIDATAKTLGEYPTRQPSTPIQEFSNGCFVCQPTMFFRRSARILLGRLDEQLKTSFDFDYWMRAFGAFPDRIGFVNTVQAYSRLHEDCITLRMRQTVALEGMQVLARYLGAAPKEWVLTFVDELLAQKRSETSVTDVRDRAEQTMALASQWMSVNEKRDLETAVARRLNDAGW
jgi:glycosyltransferase involved in cell wall biosynthesis